MKPKTRIILLSVISILIVVTIVLGITYSFMQANIESSSVTEVSLSSCAKITLKDSGVSIDLSNTYPMSKNKALETTPYTFTVTSSCETYVGFNLYLATLNTNTLADSNIHYIITDQGTTNIVAEGILSNATNALSELTNEEQTQLNNGINGTFATIYRLYNDSIPLQGSVSYDLYLYVDSEVTDASTMGKTFNAGIAIKSYDREADPTTLADYIIKEVYTGTDGDNDLYYHDADLANGAQDNSYRYSGANPNNYVCFGATGADCQNEDNQYRIIGVFGDEVKLIKWDYANSDLLGTGGTYSSGTYSASSYGNYNGAHSTVNTYYWNETESFNHFEASNIWSESILNTMNLNGTYLSGLGTWASMIAEHDWEVGGMAYSNTNTAKQYYATELGNSDENSVTYRAKIGLMYVTDYGYAASGNHWATELYNYESATDNNWMYMGMREWTISPASSNSRYAFAVYDTGCISINEVYESMSASAVRPVFYLESNVQLEGGSGTSSDPYTLAV